MAKSGKKGKKSQKQISSGDKGNIIQIQLAKEKKKGKRERKATGLKIQGASLGEDGHDPAAERTAMMEGVTLKASLGFCFMDVIDTDKRIEWRAFNDRTLNSVIVTKLKNNFVDNGQQVTSPDAVFRLLVHKEWLDVEPHIGSIAGLMIKDLKELKFKEIAEMETEKPIYKIDTCGGNHRRDATRLYKIYCAEKEEEALLQLQEVDSTTDPEIEVLKNAPALTQNMWTVKRKKLIDLRARRQNCRYWGVELLDIGERPECTAEASKY